MNGEPLFSGLVFDENDQLVETTTIGDEPCYVVDDDGFRTLTKIMLEIAHISGGGRLLSLLEGGYSPLGLASAVHAHIDEMSRA